MNPFDVNSFLSDAGLIGMIVLLFIETGLLIGFIFPGDTLIFTAGVLSTGPRAFAHLWQLLIFLPLAAMIGDQCGYFIGKHYGPRVLRGRLIKFIGQEPIDKTYRFFDKFGAFAVFIGRFVGIVRTLIPILSGFSRMSHTKFTICSVAGCIVWCDGILLLGYYLGNIPIIEEHLDLFIVASVLTIIVPTVATVYVRTRRRRKGRPERIEAENPKVRVSR